jgi:hypothetical protein
MFVEQRVKYLTVEVMDAELDENTLYYQLTLTNLFLVLLCFNELKFKWPLTVYTHMGKSVELNSSSHTCPLA